MYKNREIARMKFATNTVEHPMGAHRRYIFMALDDELAVILDTRLKAVRGFINTDCIEIARRLPCFAYQNDNHRFTFKYNEYNTTISLAIAISCYKSGFFSSKMYHVHHIFNVCDNRIEKLQRVTPYSIHKPVYHDSNEYIEMVLGEKGYTVDEVLEMFGLKR